MALQFTSGLQQSYVKLIEDVGTALIHILKDFANTPKFVSLIGKNNRPFIKEFTGDSIAAINRVVVDIGNPLSRTIAGRVQMAEQLLQMNLIKTPQQYFSVMETGRLDMMYEGELDQLMAIKAENERLMEGMPVKATLLDPHRMHIMEHKAVLADPDLRKDNELTKKVMDHISEHIDLLRNTDPDLLALIGEQPLPPPGAQMPPTPTGQSIPQQPTQGSLENSPMSEITGTEQAQSIATAPGEVTGLPKMPRPPAPFQNMPVNPQDMIPS